MLYKNTSESMIVYLAKVRSSAIQKAFFLLRRIARPPTDYSKVM
jgi:hypothetical protein